MGPPSDVLELPGEFDRVDALLMGWHADAWSYLSVYGTIVREASKRAHVVMLLADGEQEEFVRSHLASAGADMRKVELVHVPLDSVWIRDYGPLVVRTRERRPRAIDMPYDRLDDDRVPALLAERAGWSLSNPPIHMDGGHLLSDGTGRCIATQDLLDLNAAMAISEGEVRSAVKDYLGCRELLVVPALADEATGHVDLMVYLTGPNSVLVGKYRRWEDPENHRRLEVAAQLLSDAGFQVMRVPMPSNGRRRIFRSYTNALALNDAVFMPVYARDRRYEREALRVFRKAFPGRTVIPVLSDTLMEMGGAIHCITMTVGSP